MFFVPLSKYGITKFLNAVSDPACTITVGVFMLEYNEVCHKYSPNIGY
jgi:hypothetical protein